MADTVDIQLTPVEQAYVHEVATQAEAAQHEIQRQASTKLAVVLAAHGMTGHPHASFHFDGKTWVLRIPASDPPVNDQ